MIAIGPREIGKAVLTVTVAWGLVHIFDRIVFGIMTCRALHNCPTGGWW